MLNYFLGKNESCKSQQRIAQAQTAIYLQNQELIKSDAEPHRLSLYIIIHMSSAFSIEKYYRTQPPQTLGSPKVPNVMEYVIFSGTPLHLSIEEPDATTTKVPVPMLPLDHNNGKLILERSGIELDLKPGFKVIASFGYKRKRASFVSEIVEVSDRDFKVQAPSELSLTNLRRNPRLVVDPQLKSTGIHARMKVKSTVGDLEITNIEPYEFSQLGMSLFVDRSKGLVLPGDQVESLEIFVAGERVLQTQGFISRVDMKRRSPEIPDSYQIVLLFRNSQSGEKVREINRTARRTPILDDKPCFFSAEHPLFPGRKLMGQVFEISTSGLSCVLEKTSFPVVPGTRFLNCQLQLPFCESRVMSFEVAHVDFRSDGENNQFKVGGQFIDAPVELIKDITNYSQTTQAACVEEATEADLDLLWEFMFETNFVYQNKRKQLQNSSKEILETYHKLLSQENSLARKLIFKEDDEIKGHVSAIRFYDKSWIIQHLNALKSDNSSAAQAVVQSIVDFFYDDKAHQNNETFYVMSFYRPDNLYPTILFGESANRINDPLKSCLIDFAFGIYDYSQFHRNSKYQIVEDAREDLTDLADHLIAQDQISLVRALGLDSADGIKLKVGEDYKKIGLFRERHLLSSKTNGLKVYALVECGSPGLNLSELTNSIQIFVEGSKLNELNDLVKNLLVEAFEKYFEPRGLAPVVLTPVDSAQFDGVRWSKIYRCWITSAQAVRDFDRVSQSVAGEFKELVKQVRKSKAVNESQ